MPTVMTRRASRRFAALLAISVSAISIRLAAAEEPSAAIDLGRAVATVVARAVATQVPHSSPVADDRAWAGVQALKAGARVSVVRRDGSTVDGRVDRVTADAIDVRRGSVAEPCARADVERINVPSLTKRLVYGSIGVAAGVVAGFFLCPSCVNEGNASLSHGLERAGAAVGSVFFLFPQHTTIYRAPRTTAAEGIPLLTPAR